MGIGDSIGKAAENAMEDLAGTSTPTENAKVPEPTDPNSDVEVHSSISEGSNAMEAEKEKAPGLKTGSATGPVSSNPATPAGSDSAMNDNAPAGTRSGEDSGPTEPPRDVPGPAGLPEGDPDSLRADPSEGDQDPSTGMGRG
ncbi:hypothetical protein F8G81_01205 [Arthrobacter sp. CDRTa11]|uniref:hypothetical protein n=1 Tax=Arthrobacter sp. CDRTa11 TaxID=2651199 RepID=UPI002265D5BC|nr:hypothetical protein [Arthrobacter sp. CDRTa11]UZX01386.1 hypothetical protein F8G81_01205 [Arthrobacter sp. CDRTa11]